MYQRRSRLPRGGRRVRRRRGSRLPLYAFALAVLSFALTLPPEEPDRPAQTATVRSLASLPDRECPPDRVPEEGPALPPEPDAPDPSAWNLTLVNSQNPLPGEYAFTPQKLSNGLKVDERCYPDLQEMLDACRAAGLSPVVCSAYRSYEKQEQLYENKVSRLMARGYSGEEARAEAARAVALPGTSEHQLGLAVDLVDLDNQNLDETQEGTAVQQWLMAHSWEYGFILRYPSDKSALTGIIYEPWHYRYVGREAAEEIYGQGVCLEEYLGKL